MIDYSLECRLSARLSVTMCIATLWVGVGGLELYGHVTNSCEVIS